MGAGIRATVAFSNDGVCPVAARSAAVPTTITRVGGSPGGGPAAPSVSEFSADAALPTDGEFTEVFAHKGDRRYRRTHGEEPACPCEYLATLGCPVSRYVAREGTLTLVFHAADYAELQTIVGELRERFPDMDVKRFVRSPGEAADAEHVLVDRGKLTARQLEILETAQEMGYFERPRRANATEVAAELDITPSTFSEHLAAAQRKLLADVL